jgi:hypothetical protein
MAPPVQARPLPWTLVGESVLWPLGPSVSSLPSIGDCRGVAGQPGSYYAAAGNPSAFSTSLLYGAKADGRHRACAASGWRCAGCRHGLVPGSRRRADTPRRGDARRPLRGRGRGSRGIRRPVPPLEPPLRPRPGSRLRALVGAERMPVPAAGQGSRRAPGSDEPGGGGGRVGRAGGPDRRGARGRSRGAAAAARPAAGGSRPPVLPGPVRTRDRHLDGHRPGHREVHHVTGHCCAGRLLEESR